MKAKINKDLLTLARDIDTLKLDKRNARKHGKRDLEAIAKSLETHGQQKPIVGLKDGTVIAGNGTLEAARLLGWEKLAVVQFDSSDEAKARAYAIIDNRSAELSEWNVDALISELSFLTDLDASLASTTGFTLKELADLKLEKDGPENYSRKIVPPIYEIQGEKPPITALVDRTKTVALIKEIDQADIPKEVADFLRFAAERHAEFSFAKIAEFYAHSPAEVQRLFEKSALVIIDINAAIENGFVAMSEKVLKKYAADPSSEEVEQ